MADEHRGLTRQRRPRSALMLALLSASWHAQAHEAGPSAIPDSGVRAGVAIAAALSDARYPLPSATLPGVLGTGQPARDSRGLRLEHAVADVAGRSAFGLGGQLAVGAHDRDKPHVEAAWIDMALWEGLYLGGGRNTVPTTPALSRAGHFDRFALIPLAKRALFEGNWTEDGLVLNGRPHDGWGGPWPDRAGLGVWRGRAFPAGGRPAGSARDRPMTLNLGWDVGNTVQLDVFAARTRPEGRGSLLQSTDAGHAHGSPTCEATLVGRVCFDGRVALWGGSLSWTPTPAWAVAATAVLRDEKGALYSSNGDARYRGRITGGWADIIWRLDPRWELAARLERLVARQELEGPGASLVAQDAGLTDNDPRQRLAAALTWSGWDRMRLSLEGGDDRSTGSANPYVMLRAVWQFDTDRFKARTDTPRPSR